MPWVLRNDLTRFGTSETSHTQSNLDDGFVMHSPLGNLLHQTQKPQKNYIPSELLPLFCLAVVAGQSTHLNSVSVKPAAVQSVMPTS